MNRKVIYTCITGGYDDVQEQTYVNPEYDYICFTDDMTTVKDSMWEFRPLVFSELTGLRNSRWHKLHPHDLFPQYDESLWIDGNLDILSPKFFDTMNIEDDDVIRVSRHPHQRYLWDEYALNRELDKDDLNLMRLEEEKIKSTGFDGDYRDGTFFETGIMWRRHNDPRCRELMDDWWWWIDHYSFRDQLSFTYVLWEKGMTVGYLFDENLRTSDMIKFADYVNHRNPNEYRSLWEASRAQGIEKDKLIGDLQKQIMDMKQIINGLANHVSLLQHSRSYRLGHVILTPYRMMKKLLGRAQN